MEHIFNEDESGVQPKIPEKFLIYKEDETMPGFNTSKDRITLQLERNAAGLNSSFFL